MKNGYNGFNFLDTTPYGKMIAHAAHEAVEGIKKPPAELTEEQLWAKMREQCPYNDDKIPEKAGYGLVISGEVIELAIFRKQMGEPNGIEYGKEVYVRAFDTKEERDVYKDRIKQLLAPLVKPDLKLDEREGENVTKRPVALVTLKYKGKEYDVRKEYSYGYPLDTVIFDWEENNFSCDCNRRLWIERFYPGALEPTPQVCDDDTNPCGEEIRVTAFGIAYAEGKVDHSERYPNEVLTPR
jgi:hypothetical protein